MGDCNERATLVIENYFFHTQRLYTCKLALVKNADQTSEPPKSTDSIVHITAH